MLANVVMVWREIFFTCGGCGGEREQGVDYRTCSWAPSPVAVAVLSESYDVLGGRQSSELLLACAHTTCGVGLGVDCVNLQTIHMSIKVCAL